jgi:hypothetical protein
VSVATSAGVSGRTLAGLPWPDGDPGALSGASQQAGSAADLLRTRGARLDAAATHAAAWKGQGAGAFRAAVAQERASILHAASGLEQAAAALRRLSTVVREAQELVRQLADEVQRAEEEAERAAARAALADAAAIAAGALVALAPDPSPSLERAADEASSDAQALGSAASDAAAHAQAVRERNTRRAQEACDEVLRQDRATAAAVDRAADLVPLSGVPAGAATPATGFALLVLGDLTPDQWRQIAYWRAGIDGGAWNPYDGLWVNDATVQAVYRYYGNLFLNHPEFQWAGMANIVGPMFYGGWQDMHAIREELDTDDDGFDLLGAVLPSIPGGALGAMPGPLRDLIGAGRDLSAGEIEYFEDQFLVMQKAIFDDLAWQHEAFALGGAALMSQLHANHPDQIDDRTLLAWQDIASGDPDRVAGGNEWLLRREQERVIQPYYDEMRNYHGIVGDTATYALSTMAENPLPGGHAYRDYDPVSVGFDVDTPDIPVGSPLPWGPHYEIGTPDVHVHMDLPIPAGNLSNFDDRWAWIENDMLPAYHDLLSHPGAAQAIVQVPVDDRAADFRKFPDFAYPGD